MRNVTTDAHHLTGGKVKIEIPSEAQEFKNQTGDRNDRIGWLVFFHFNPLNQSRMRIEKKSRLCVMMKR